MNKINFVAQVLAIINPEFKILPTDGARAFRQIDLDRIKLGLIRGEKTNIFSLGPASRPGPSHGINVSVCLCVYLPPPLPPNEEALATRYLLDTLDL